MSMYTTFALAVVIGSAYLFYNRSKNSRLPLPPGPKGYPIIGNLLDLPNGSDWITYRDWSRQYGSDVLHVNVMGTSIVILNSWDVVNDLIEKRSNLYSSRPIRTMVNELMGWDVIFAFMPYGERWRQHRKLFYQEFNATAALRYQPQEISATNTLLGNLAETPDDWVKHLRLHAGRVIMSVAYGIDVKSEKHMYLDVIEKALAGLNIAGRPGAFLCDTLPFLKHVPGWVPGTGFKKQAREWHHWVNEMVELPFQAAKDRIASGIAQPSYTSYLLEGFDSKEDNHEKERMVKETAAAIYSAGADTTVAVIISFVLAMIWYPEVQKKAQLELDTVLGKGHLPNFSDEASLPYCGALIKELFRWRPVTPMAIPRETDVEDEYAGYRIPPAVIIPNAWAILHDERIYPEPSVFNPERFLKNGQLDLDVMDPTVAAFGFGRRICPGRFLATASIWNAVTSILATLNVTKAIGADGAIIEPSGEMAGGMVHATIPFKCSIKPRSEETLTLIKSVSAA